MGVTAPAPRSCLHSLLVRRGHVLLSAGSSFTSSRYQAVHTVHCKYLIMKLNIHRNRRRPGRPCPTRGSGVPGSAGIPTQAPGEARTPRPAHSFLWEGDPPCACCPWAHPKPGHCPRRPARGPLAEGGGASGISRVGRCWREVKVHLATGRDVRSPPELVLPGYLRRLRRAPTCLQAHN